MLSKYTVILHEYSEMVVSKSVSQLRGRGEKREGAAAVGNGNGNGRGGGGGGGGNQKGFSSLQTAWSGVGQGPLKLRTVHFGDSTIIYENKVSKQNIFLWFKGTIEPP
jgi:hypothetical protein